MMSWQVDPEITAMLRVEKILQLMQKREHQQAIIEAEELLEQTPNHAKGLFLLAEALLERGEMESAVATYKQHLSIAEPIPCSLVGLGIARFGMCDFTGCAENCRQAIDLAPDRAEAYYFLGLCLEREPGGRAEAAQCLVTAQRLAPENYPLPLELTDEEWQALLQQALAQMPEQLQSFWSEVPVVMEELPPTEELLLNTPTIAPTVCGLARGVTPTTSPRRKKRPQALALFTGNLARCPSRQNVVQELARTLEHEALTWQQAHKTTD